MMVAPLQRASLLSLLVSRGVTLSNVHVHVAVQTLYCRLKRYTMYVQSQSVRQILYNAVLFKYLLPVL